MQEATQNAVHALLRADATLTPQARRDILTAMQNNGKPVSQTERPARIVRRKEAAKILSCTTRTVDNLCKSGALPRVKLPGRERALGIRESDLLTLIADNKEIKEVE